MSQLSILKLSRFWLFTLSHLVISISAFGQKKNEINANSCQLATIHRDTILIKLKEYPAQIKILDAYQKQLQAEFDFKKLEFDTKLKDYQEKEATLTAEQKGLLVDQLQQQESNLNDFSKEANSALVKKEKELLLPMNEKINKAIVHVAAENGYLQLIDSKTCYYFNPKCDATQLVIEQANKK